MRTLLLHVFVLLAAVTVSQCVARDADTNPPPRLTIELRDGSRVVGVSVAKNFSFRSALLGDLKLEVKNIRSIECVSSNQTKLVTTGGDTLKVSFIDSSVAVKTSFGKVDLAVDSIRQLTVSLSGGAPVRREGLVALWSGEGNAADSVNGSNGELINGAAFGPGKFGQSFKLNENDAAVSENRQNAYVFVAAKKTGLDLSGGSGLTITAWINPTKIFRHMPIVDFSGPPGTDTPGLCFWISANPANGTGAGCVFANVMEANGTCHNVTSAPRLVIPNVWQQVALTYHKATGVATLFLDGKIVAKENLGSFTPKVNLDLCLGGRIYSTSADYPSDVFSGRLDEIGLYNRALSGLEISEDFEAVNKN